MAELKPCRFCGGATLLYKYNAGLGASYFRCEKCGVKSIRFIKPLKIDGDDRAVDSETGGEDDEHDNLRR